MFEKNNFTIGFYKKMLKTNELIEVIEEEDVYESEFVFGLKNNVFFDNNQPLFHGDSFYVKEKNEYITFHFEFNPETNNVKQYGFSFFDKYFNNFYTFNNFKEIFKDCTFIFVGNIFIHQTYLFENFSKQMHLANIYYKLQILSKENHFKVTFGEKSTIHFSLNKEKINIDKKTLFKSLNYPSSSFNFKIEKEVNYIHKINDNEIEFKELIQGYDGSIYSLMENSFEEDEVVENNGFMLYINNGSPLVINSKLQEVEEIPLPFMEENWNLVERESKTYKEELLKFIS